VEVPQTRYARSGDVNMAYQVGGTGACDLVWIPGFVQHVELAWEEPYRAHWLARLAERFRLIVFDKRGTGLSDRIVGEPSLETRMDDSRAVPGAAGSDRAAVAAAATPAPWPCCLRRRIRRGRERSCSSRRGRVRAGRAIIHGRRRVRKGWRGLRTSSAGGDRHT
jgi:hypothetical protein